MTIGNKIVQIRTQHNLSQEQLAEALGVSRQSVSKWEMDQALPQIDKVLLISDLFGISTDTLLRDSAPLPCAPAEGTAHRYFGTDGFRGEAGEVLTSMHAYQIGRFLGWYYTNDAQGHLRPRIAIGKDTRRSCYMLEYALAAGIAASGADAYMLHVTTTPSISYVTRQDAFDCGIMITASHNPYHDNGIKIVNSHGEKLGDDVVSLIEAYLDGDLTRLGTNGRDLPLAKGERIGCIHDYVSGRNRYIGYLISLASNSFKHLRLGIDCANGAAWSIARAVFGALGAQVHLLAAEPNGVNINRSCGSTHIENLKRLVVEQHLDMGFAFDGDADRCIAVDEHGNTVDGDAILYILAKRLRAKGILNGNTVVSTVMSNSGLTHSLERQGIRCVQSNVGDKAVWERMQKEGFCLGGEKTGHIIIKKYATTGDGLLTAILLAEEVCDSKSTLSALTDGLCLYPQHSEALPVRDKHAVLTDPAVAEALRRAQMLLSGHGRILLRESGTEEVVRIMAEGEDEALCAQSAGILREAIEQGGHLSS